MYNVLEIFTVVFFGHRYIDNPLKVEELIEEQIRKFINEKEYVDFIVGRNGEFDQCVSSTVLRVRKNYRDDIEEKVDFLKNAIKIKPLQLQQTEEGIENPYKMLIDTYKSDGAFSVAEEEVFKNIIRSYDEQKQKSDKLEDLRTVDGYAELSFEIGKLYWYYYDYGKTDTADNDVTRMKSAIQWFDDAVKYGSESDSFYTMATVYRDIGEFNRDINLNVQEATDTKEMYSSYWTNLSDLVEIITQSKDESEIVELEIYELTMNSIEQYARKFKNKANVSQSDMQQLFDTVKEALNDVSTTSDTTEDIKASVVSRVEQTQSAIDNAYRE